MTMLTKGPIDHILRESAPPWRRGPRLTECGLTADNHPTLTRADAAARWKELGAQRASLFTCMTCAHTADRHHTWAQDPVSAMERECGGARWRSGSEDADVLRAEFAAIAALIEAHPEEFYGYLDGLADTVDLTAKRRGRNRL